MNIWQDVDNKCLRLLRKISLGEKHQCVVACRVPPGGDLAHNPGMCPDWKLNWQPFGSQACTQSTEPHPPGLVLSIDGMFREPIFPKYTVLEVKFNFFSLKQGTQGLQKH